MVGIAATGCIVLLLGFLIFKYARQSPAPEGTPDSDMGADWVARENSAFLQPTAVLLDDDNTPVNVPDRHSRSRADPAESGEAACTADFNVEIDNSDSGCSADFGGDSGGSDSSGD